ncbi:MAG: hypothetical protein AB1394_12865 [Bacteroidota bacterium]
MNKKKNFLVVFSFLVVLAGAMVFSGCETSRVAPEVPRPNPPAPEPQPVVLSSYVLDGGTGGGIPSATVSLTKLDGTVISTAVTNASGLYSFNLIALNVADAALNVSTNVTGYGYGFRVATFDKALGSAAVAPIVLTKITSTTTVTIGATGGAASTPPTNEAKATTPVSVTVPPNAVPANTPVTLAAVPVASTPPPSTPPTQNLLTSNTLAAPGVSTFGAPVTMTFNLPFPLTAGTTIPVLLLNPTTNKWESSGLNATVSANGLTAAVQVTRPGSYALLGNVSVAQTVVGKFLQNDESINITRVQKVLDTKAIIIEMSPTNKTARYTAPLSTPPVIRIIAGAAALHPNNSFVLALINVRFGRSYTALSNLVQSFTYNLPATLGGSPTVVNGIVVGPSGFQNTSGDWINRITISERTVKDIFRTAQTGVFENETEFSEIKATVKSEWYWRVHNQGGIGIGPF